MSNPSGTLPISSYTCPVSSPSLAMDASPCLFLLFSRMGCSIGENQKYCMLFFLFLAGLLEIAAVFSQLQKMLEAV